MLVVVIITVMLGCDEKINIDEISEQLEPKVLSFEPQSVEIGSLINITGENLNYAEKIRIGNDEAVVKYKTSNSLLVAEISNNITGGVITVENSAGTGTPSEGQLTIVFKEPTFTDVPYGGNINEEVLITGSNLQYINGIQIGGEEATIVAQSSKELVFKVPFLLADQATLTYSYVSSNGDVPVALQNDGFSVVKSWPAFSSVPEKAMINTEVTIIGENMNVVDSVYFGPCKVDIISQDPLTLTFLIPNDVELEGYQAIKLYSYGGQELSSGKVLRVVTKLERMLENFESFDGDPFTVKKVILPVYESGINLNSNLTAPDGNFFAGMKIDYDQSQQNNSGSTYSEFYYKGSDNLIDLSEFDDPWVHMWINTNNTSPYFVFYSDLSQSVEAVSKDRGTHYVKKLNSADYGEGWQLFAWQMKGLKFRSGGSADPYDSDVFSIYNLKTFRIQFRTSSDIPLETSEFDFDAFMVVNGKLKDAIDVTSLGN